MNATCRFACSGASWLQRLTNSADKGFYFRKAAGIFGQSTCPSQPFRVHPILPTIVLPYRASVSRPFYRLHRRQRRQYHNRRRRNRRRNLAARIATRAGISVDATSQVLAALGLEVFHELAMYGDAVIPNLVTFNLEAGHNREFLRATTIGTFESNFRAFLA